MRKIKLMLAMMLTMAMVVGCRGSQGTKDNQIVENSSKESVETTTEEITTEEPTTVDLQEFDFTMCFAGDILLAEGEITTNNLDSSPNGLKDCISPEFLEIMNRADYTCVNNEFTYSTRGSALDGKAWTFRAHPDRVKYLKEMGVDLALLANNHVYDYGKDAMLDTLDTLTNADIKYFGAGANLEEAMKPVYVELGGKKVAFVAASRAEKNKMTPQATEEEPGILRCYDPTLFIEVIKEARANADFVVACVHWGTERSTVLEDAQLETARQYIDAGADMIIGSHSHCLQGMEYYNGKPIVYSLGNYWFDEYYEDTMLVNVRIYGDINGSNVELSVVPGMQDDGKTVIFTDDSEKERVYQHLEDISVNIEIDENGVVRSKE
ncbi:MAG: CapA family protein [Lachnospiraceae bacterium]|nr:CapA family protein [Lachnospiraceae bacterium]